MQNLNMKPDNLLIFAALGIAAWYLVTRKATAAPISSPKASVNQFYRSPARAPAPVFPGAQRNNALASVGVGLLSNLFGVGPIRGYKTAASAESEGSAGEALASDYYVNNRENFSSIVPSDFNSYSGDYGGIDSL